LLGRFLGRIQLGDLVAGLSVALVLVPQSLAYAQLAGMPAYRGLYAAALPPLAAALFASSPYLQTGPVALTALLTFAALTNLAPPGSDEYVTLGIVLALIVGVVRVLVGLLRAGVIAYLISQPTMLGFVSAAAILIIASQLPSALGVEAPGDGVLEDAVWAIGHPAAWEVAAIVLALVTGAIVVAGGRLHRLFPGVLVAAGIGIAYSLRADYDGAVVGSIPTEWPVPSFSIGWGDLPELLLSGVIIALVGFVEPSSIARTYAALERRPWNANREFVSQGVANVVSGLSGAFPVGGSFSRSALNYSAGARTRLSGAITGLAVLAFLPFADALSSLPTAVLAAIVIGAAVGLVRILPLVRLWRYSRPQFVIAWVTFGLTLGLAPHIEWAVLAGIGLAVAVHLARELSFDIEFSIEDSTLHLRPSGVLWFGSGSILEDTVVGLLADHPGARRLVVHLDGLGRIDLSGALVLRSLLQDARRAGLEVCIEDVPPRARRVASRILESRVDPLSGR
jgi:sulfate permease, SulP family